MPEKAPDIEKMIQEEIDKAGGQTHEGEEPISLREPTLEERLASKRAREESAESDQQAIEKVRADIAGEGAPAAAAETEKPSSDVAGKEKAEPYAEENAELLSRAEGMKKQLESGKKIDDQTQAELFRDIAETVIKENGLDYLPAVEKLAGRYKGAEQQLTSMDKAMKVVESFYPEFRKLMSEETARSPENMVSRMKKVLESRFDGLAGRKAEGAAKETAAGKLAGDTLLDFSARLKGGETIDPQEYNKAFDKLAREMIGEKFSDLPEDKVKQLIIDLNVKRAKLFNSLAQTRDLKPETAANFQRMIDEDIRRMSLPRETKDMSRVEKSAKGGLRGFLRRMFGGR